MFISSNFHAIYDLGIDIAKVLVVEAPEILDNTNKSAANVFKSEIETLPFVDGFSMSSVVPGQEVTFRSYNLSNAKTKATINCGIIGIDVNFFTNFDVPLISGKAFSTADSSNSGVILNEEAISQLGFANAEQAIGATITHDNKGQNSKFVIEGVVKNYHHRSLQRSIEPVIFTNGRDLKFYSIKLEEQAWSAIENNVTLIGKAYDKIFPGNGYNYFFLDQNFNDQYTSEIKFELFFSDFHPLSLSLLWTFDVTFRSARLAEVGIRKVMGAYLSITRFF